MLKLSRVLSKTVICQNIGAFSGVTHHNHRLHIGETNVIGNVVDVNAKEYQVMIIMLFLKIETRNSVTVHYQ